MKIIEKSITSIQEIEAPTLLYKYRNFENGFHIKILTEREVFFAPPTSFEDTLDCKIPVRYDLLTEDDVLDMYLNKSHEFNPLWSEDQHFDFALHWTRNSPIKNIEWVAQMTQEAFKEYDSRIGILSLTANSQSKPMWDKYASESTGFCVGFDSKTLFQHLGGGGPVNYEFDELPIIYPTPKHSFDEQRQLQVFSKLRKWAFEEEYRTLILDKNGLDESSRRRIIVPEAFKVVILGSNISSHNRQKIKEMVLSMFKDVVIKE